MEPVHAVRFYSYVLHINIILPSIPRSCDFSPSKFTTVSMCALHFVSYVPLDPKTVWRTFKYHTLGTIIKVKQSHYRPRHTLRVPGGWGSQISRQSTHEGGKVISPTQRPPLPPRKYSWYSFLLEAESTPEPTVRPEGLCQWKIAMTPSGIEPATFRLVAQCLNQLGYGVPT